jgi:hypothetical protein
MSGPGLVLTQKDHADTVIFSEIALEQVFGNSTQE